MIKQLHRILPQGDYNLVGKTGVISHFFGYNCYKLPEVEVTGSIMAHISLQSVGLGNILKI